MSEYKDSGVDVEAGYRAVELMKRHVETTRRREVIGDLGGFGGAFSLSSIKDMVEPVMISGTDGVGTKLKIAHILDKHDTIGIDCVAMCVNDIVCGGSQPLFFLDYIACGKNVPEKIEKIVSGVARGCVLSNCSLIGGETAEMPGFYAEDEYDIAGFVCGVVDRPKMISTDDQRRGDYLVGLASSGVHSNGFSLVRRLFDIDNNPSILDKHIDELGTTIGEELLRPTQIYVNTALKINEMGLAKGIAHITGGGFIENIPRALKSGLGAAVDSSSFEILPIFKIMQSMTDMSNLELFSTFNCGIGMVIVCEEKDCDEVIEIARSESIDARVIGQVVSGEGVTIS